MHVAVLLIAVAVAAMVLGVVLFLIGRRGRMNRAARTGVDRAGLLAIVGIAVFAAGALSLARAF